MALTPLLVIALRRFTPAVAQSMEGIEAARGLGGTVLIIGFGRFGQVASQALLARGCDIAIIDTDTEMIRSAAEFGFKVYYGDGTRVDVLRASGAQSARLIAVCVDDRAAADRIVGLARREFTQAKLLVRAYDREHAARLVALGADTLVRETFESALLFGSLALRELGVSEEVAAETLAEVRRSDAERFQLELAQGDVRAGRHLMLGNGPRPTPFTKPTRQGRPLSEETAQITGGTAGSA
jgi:glutathione-regulated potassium-efflux system protein KefB